MTRFVERDTLGRVVGHYNVLQPGIAEEEVADDHPDLLAFREARQLREQQVKNAQIVREFSRVTELENIKRRLQRIEAFLNLTPDGNLNSMLAGTAVRSRGTVSSR